MTYKRKEIIGDCTLYLGDCLEVMPLLGVVDAVVTDPPWNMDYFKDDKKEWGEYVKWLQELNFIYGDISHVQIIFLSSKSIPFVSHLFKDYQPFVAVKNFSQMAKSKNILPNAFDVGFCKINGSYTGKGRNWFMCNTAGMLQERSGHPTPRTVGCMENVLSWIDCNLILDPFMGSGTTGVACVKLGRKFIGIELEEKYFDIACKRIEEAYKQPDMFIEVEKKPEQDSFFDKEQNQ